MTSAAVAALVLPLVVLAIALLLFCWKLIALVERGRRVDMGALGAALADIGELTARTAGDTARAIGESVAVALAPSPQVETPAEVTARLSHELADLQNAGLDDDDTDPTDAFLGVERADVAFVDFADPSAFGIPGFRPPRVAEES